MAAVNRVDAPQNYRTPPELLDVVQAQFGRITFDAACTHDDAVAARGYFYPEFDALACDWADLRGEVVWCNPPFARSAAFAESAAKSQRSGALAPRVILLTPASVDSNWFAQYVLGRALVLPLSPRVRFVAQPAAINRALMLSVYGPDVHPGFQPWRWRS